MERFAIACAALLVAVACNSTSLKKGFCHTDRDCPPDQMCGGKLTCVERNDGSVDESEAGDAKDAMLRCPESISCADGGYDGGSGVCDTDAGVCVECLEDIHCAGKPKTPICKANVCRGCKTDAECPDPKICMTDGHCATSDEVIYVEFSSSGCPGADGSSANPYCAPNDAVAHLASGQNVIVIRGPAADRMTLNTTGLSPVIVGKNSASIPATAATAIQILSDTILIRDLTVTGGTAGTSKGIAASGSMTKLTLLNVQVNLGSGLGIQVDNGAELTMDRSTVTNNLPKSGAGGGGILLDGAHFDISNTTVSNNGPGTDVMGNVWGGIRVTSPPTTSPIRLHLLTVQSNNPVGVSCAGTVSGDGVLSSGNTSVEVTMATCGFSSCGSVVTSTCGSPQ